MVRPGDPLADAARHVGRRDSGRRLVEGRWSTRVDPAEHGPLGGEEGPVRQQFEVARPEHVHDRCAAVLGRPAGPRRGVEPSREPLGEPRFKRPAVQPPLEPRGPVVECEGGEPDDDRRREGDPIERPAAAPDHERHVPDGRLECTRVRPDAFSIDPVQCGPDARGGYGRPVGESRSDADGTHTPVEVSQTVAERP